jgi:hypothetical protein
MSYSGVFLSGPLPYFVMLGGKSQDPLYLFDAVETEDIGLGLKLLETPLMKSGSNYPRVHPFMRDAAVVAFSEFHNEVSPRGFLYLNAQV